MAAHAKYELQIHQPPTHWTELIKRAFLFFHHYIQASPRAKHHLCHHPCKHLTKRKDELLIDRPKQSLYKQRTPLPTNPKPSRKQLTSSKAINLTMSSRFPNQFSTQSNSDLIYHHDYHTTKLVSKGLS